MNDPGSITNVYRQMTAGDPQAVEALWSRFFRRLSGLARQSLGDRIRRVVDVDDVLQSTLFGFWRQAQRGDYASNVNRHPTLLIGKNLLTKTRFSTVSEQARGRLFPNSSG